MKVLRSKNVTTDSASPEQGQGAVFTPGALFFTQVTPWPQGVEAKDLPALVALSLEESSPFALDSLAWGFCSDAESRTVFLYAACLPRISSAEQDIWPLAGQVYPAFLPLVAAREPVAAGNEAGAGSDFKPSRELASAASAGNGIPLPPRELLFAGREVLLLERSEGSRWPQRIRCEALEAEAEVSAEAVRLAAVRLLLKSGLAADAASAEQGVAALPFWQVAATDLSRRNEMRFTLDPVAVADGGDKNASGDSDASDGQAEAARGAASVGYIGSATRLHTVLAGEETLWQADLRTEDFVALTRKSRLADQRLWYGLCAAACAIAVLLLMLLGYWWLGTVAEKRAATLAAQTPAVERVRQDQDLLMRMRQFSADPFAPFSLIGALKAGKPEPIYFDAIELSGPDAVIVEGQGPTVDAVNAYVRSLEQSGAFRAARQARMNLKDGASVFTLYLQYLGQPPLSAAVPQSQTEVPPQPDPAQGQSQPVAADSVSLRAEPLHRQTDLGSVVPVDVANTESSL